MLDDKQIAYARALDIFATAALAAQDNFDRGEAVGDLMAWNRYISAMNAAQLELNERKTIIFEGY